MNRIVLRDLEKVNLASIQRAGPRYTPTLEPKAPNLQIGPLVSAINALAHSSAYKKQLDDLEKELRVAWREVPAEVLGLFDSKITASVLCATFLTQLRNERPGSSLRTLRRIRQTLAEIQKRIRPYESRLYNERTEPTSPDTRDTIAHKIYALDKFQEPIRKLHEFTASPDFALVQNNLLFLNGGWGTGKTHLLCDIVKARAGESLPSLLLLAQTFPRGIDPLVAVCQISLFPRTPQKLLGALNQLGRKSGTRALLVIDGINEGDRVAWRRYMRAVINRMRRFHNVALIVSCRTPFEDQLLTAATRRDFVELTHTGFVDIEFDAQKEFFSYYNIPTPHIPLLAPEFSRPLFLKILCTSIASLSRGAKHKQLTDFASGHKGMTKLLEDFVVKVGKKIEQDFNLTDKSCWRLLKGEGDGISAVGIAVLMAEQGQDYISKDDCLRIISRITHIASPDRAEALLARLVTDGLLAEDGIHNEAGTWTDTIRLPYQRFSDHLISRHLLSRYLKVDSETAVRRCFYANRPLGRIFKPDQWRRDFEMPGLASALMLEFPERVKRKLGDDRELAFYLPRASRTDALIEPFIEGLLWRSTDSFCKQTDRFVSILLDSRARHVQREMLEALVCLGSRTGHPYCATGLWRFLSKKNLVERDLFWSEFLRSRENTSAVYRVLDWIQAIKGTALDAATTANLIQLCAAFLTTTVRTLRDRATHCLVLLGEQQPSILFEATVRSFAFNDPYVPERMLASSYGVLMRKWAFAPGGLGDAAVALATDLRQRLVGSDAVAPIEHILMRDCAEGIIALAIKLSPADELRLSLKGLPISQKSLIPSGDHITEDSVKAASAGIHMDFDNYTTGRLVENRGNYDFTHNDYRDVQRQIRWRMLDLGYDPEKFKHIDRSIGESNFRMGRADGGKKIDRYGKKYSWIGFYEVAGRRRLDGTLPHRDEIRISDTDIDPSFPDAPLTWRPAVQPLFHSVFRSASGWARKGPSPDYRHLLVRSEVDHIHGPWMLLQGYINETAPNDQRAAFSFLRGLFLAEADVDRLESTLAGKDYPGNHQIPEPGEDYYLFAGEIGWSNKFGSSLRDSNGHALPQLGEAFEHTEHRVIKKRYGELTASEMEKLTHPSLEDLLSSLGRPTPGRRVSPRNKVELQEWVQVPGVTVELPVWRFAWESYHSEENTGGHPDYPAPALVDVLGLRKRGASVDLVQEGGRVAMLYRRWGTAYEGFNGRLLYLRADLVQKYLSTVGRVLVWINWGERTMHHDAFESLRQNPAMQAVWTAHAHIHKQFVVYRGGKVVPPTALAISSK